MNLQTFSPLFLRRALTFTDHQTSEDRTFEPYQPVNKAFLNSRFFLSFLPLFWFEIPYLATQLPSLRWRLFRFHSFYLPLISGRRRTTHRLGHNSEGCDTTTQACLRSPSHRHILSQHARTDKSHSLDATTSKDVLPFRRLPPPYRRSQTAHNLPLLRPPEATTVPPLITRLPLASIASFINANTETVPPLMIRLPPLFIPSSNEAT